MGADVIEIRPPSDTRPERERSFEAAVTALHAVVKARDDAVRALGSLAESFVALDDESYKETLAFPFEEVIRRHSAETIALWQHISFVQENLDGEGDVFDVLTRLDVPELEEAFTAWKRANGIEEDGDA